MIVVLVLASNFGPMYVGEMSAQPVVLKQLTSTSSAFFAIDAGKAKKAMKR